MIVSELWMQEMQEDDVSTFVGDDAEFGVASAMISVFEKMAMWQHALNIFTQIDEPNRVDYSTILLAMSGDARSLAKDLYLKSPFPPQALRQEGEQVVDLHEMPVGVATLALEILLEDLQDARQVDLEVSPVTLCIITGRGQHRLDAPRLRPAVVELLETWPGVVGIQQPPENLGIVTCQVHTWLRKRSFVAVFWPLKMNGNGLELLQFKLKVFFFLEFFLRSLQSYFFLPRFVFTVLQFIGFQQFMFTFAHWCCCHTSCLMCLKQLWWRLHVCKKKPFRHGKRAVLTKKVMKFIRSL